MRFTFFKNSDIRAIVVLLATALLLKIPILANPTWSFSGDEGVVGLMAKHILQGSFPIYFYGQAYWGSAEAFIASFFFLIFGINAFALKLAPLLLSILFIVSQYYLAKMLFDRQIAFLSACFSAIAPSALNMWGSKAGSHIGNLFLGTLFLFLCLKYHYSKESRKNYHIFLLGIYTGFCYWTDQMIVYYIMPIAVYFFCKSELFKNIKKGYSSTVNTFSSPLKNPYILYILGFLIGTSPIFYYRLFDNSYTITAFNHDFSARQAVSKVPVFFKLFTYMAGFIENQNILLKIMMDIYLFIIFVSIAFALYFFRNDFKNIFLFKSENLSMQSIIILQFIFVPIIFIITPNDPTVQLRSRLLLPIYTSLPLLISIFFFELKRKYKRLAILFLAIILISLGFEKYSFYRERGLISSNLSLASFHDDKEDLINYLKSINAKGGYAGFWLAYEIIFRTNESIIIYPLWGFDKYPKYFDYVNSLQNPFYIYHNEEIYLHKFEDKLKKDMILFSKKIIGSYVLFYNLNSRYIHKPLPKNIFVNEFWGDLNPKIIRIN